MKTSEKAIEIITGCYGKGNEADNAVVNSIFGENASQWFELYFHWYNVIHELGHGIMHFHSKTRPHPVDEEQMVNDFAVAFWRHYGEEAKIEELNSIITFALSHLKCPAQAGVTHVQYAHENWGTETLHNFNNYGWFQFSCVSLSLREKKTLEQMLSQMGIESVIFQQKETFKFPVVSDETVSGIVENAVNELKKWGVQLPDVYVTLDNDPNRQMCNIIE